MLPLSTMLCNKNRRARRCIRQLLTMSLTDAYPLDEADLLDAYRLHISGGTFNQVSGHHNEYHFAGNLVQPQGENGITILERNISGDSLYNSEQRFPPPQCHPDTRIAVQNTIQAWADESDQASRVMWLYGPAGAGKSSIAQTMAEKWAAEDALVATFFFARWRMGGSSGKSLFPTIAYQLALQIPQLRRGIGEAVEADPAICNKTIEEQARALLVNPLEQLDVAAQKPYLVIIDGLDECDGKPMQKRIVTMIFRMLVENHLPIRFLICSRPEPNIRETFDALPPNAHFRRLVLDETFNPGRDILHYLRERFAEIRQKRLPNHFETGVSWPSERDIEKLVQNASGQFIYAATVIKFVDDEYCHPVEQLELVLGLSAGQTNTAVFADLDALYTFILTTNPNVSLLVRILGAFFAISEDERLCVSFLDALLGLPRGSIRFALRGLHSILFIPDSDDDQIQLHHTSIRDFLFNPTRAGTFFLDINQYHKDLGWRCFSIVEDNVENPERHSSTIVSYAHYHWMYHPLQLPLSERDNFIRHCLRCFRDSMDPDRLKILCGDAKSMERRFFYIIDFLRIIDIQASQSPDSPWTMGFQHDLDDTWNTLLRTLFDPIPEVLEFCMASSVEWFGPWPYIYSSLGVILQQLLAGPWNGKERTYDCDKMWRFVLGSPSPMIRLRAAEIALQLLGYSGIEANCTP
ncbi:hypothetical protein B0H11DRAFT_793492 [Mycena galericulata]|nr:hypothetical protein B0H11DRAFT_793492 [Mycena galericulata]